VSKHPKRPFLAGFAAETEDLLTHAAIKLKAKNLDLIVANQVSALTEEGIGADTLAVSVLDAAGVVKIFKEQNKTVLAFELLALIAAHLTKRSNED